MAYGDALNKNLGLGVRLRLTLAGKSQADLCAALGREQSAVSRRLHGHVAITVPDLPAIAGLLGTTPGILLDEAWKATIDELGEPEQPERLEPARLKVVA